MKDLFEKSFAVIVIPLCFIVVGGIGWLVLGNMSVNIWPTISLFLALTPIWLPFTLFFMTYEKWVDSVRLKFRYESGRVVLRIKLPPEVLKSPEAMESVLEHIHAGNGSDNLHQAYIEGKHPLLMTCELVSIGGEVRFYMTVQNKIKDLLEAQLYSQYPGIEVMEESLDYAAEVQWVPDEMDLMSFHFVKKADDVLPIRTFVDYKLDTMPKEEEKFDPMSAMLEALSNAKPHERIFIQFLCKPHRDTGFKHGDLKTKENWIPAATKKINEILCRDEKGMVKVEETEGRPAVTQGERDTITAIERNVGKLAYEVAIRGMYITLDATQFDGGKISSMISTFKQYEIIGRNGIAPRWKTDFDYSMFEDPSGRRKLDRKKQELEHYKRRHYDPGSGKANAGHQAKVMSVEELATMFHIPGRSIITPGVTRVPSTLGTAPSNLPLASSQ